MPETITAQTSVLQAECSPELKEAFVAWCKKNGFASISEALRDYARKVTGFIEKSQDKSYLN